MSETVASARMFGFDGDWVALERHHYDKHPEGDVVFYEVAEKLERERDEARKEIAEVISCIEQAIVHNQFNSAFVIRNLLENINRRRKRNE